MGTRGALGVRIGGEDKITYSQFDSYPGGWPSGVVSYLRKADMKELMELAIALKAVSGRPTEADRIKCAAYTDARVGNGNDWYALLRETQGHLARILACGVYEDASGFLSDSLMCEWAYIVNFDENVFEVYRGFQRVDALEAFHQVTALGKGRYFLAKNPEDGYAGVALLTTFPLQDIPENWAHLLDPPGEE